jgi:hypothetical protein
MTKISETIRRAEEEWKKIDFVEAFATHPNRCWHNEHSPTLERDREENLKHIQDFKDHILFYIKSTNLALLKAVEEMISEMKIEEAPPFSANDETREQAKLINEYLMPAVKEKLLSLLHQTRYD